MNPQQFAALALRYLDRVPSQSRADRYELAAVEDILRQIGEGKLIVGAPAAPKPKRVASAESTK